MGLNRQSRHPPIESHPPPQTMVVSFDVRTNRPSRSAGVYPETEQEDGQRSNSPFNDVSMLARPAPRYSTLSVATLPAYPNPAEFDISGVGQDNSNGDPRGTGPRRSFEFSLQSAASSTKSGSDSWLKLRLLTSASTMAQRPRYIGGDKVEGSVILDGEKPRLVHSVVVIVSSLLSSSLISGQVANFRVQASRTRRYQLSRGRISHVPRARSYDLDERLWN